MIQTVFFYRELFSENFLQTENPKNIIPVRPKNEFNPENIYYSDAEREWVCIAEDSDDKNMFSEENPGNQAAEFVETPLLPTAPFFEDREFCTKDYETGRFTVPELEDFSPMQMEKFLKYRWQKKRYEFNKLNFKDKRGIDKDYHSAKIITDTENLTLTVSFYKFFREENRSTEVPETEEKTLFFDMKNGSVDLFSDYHAKTADNEFHNKIIDFCEYLEQFELPLCILQKAFEKILELAELFTGVSFEEMRNSYKTKKDLCYLLGMYKLTMLPFCPDLYNIIHSLKIKKRHVYFRYKRTDSKVFKRFCRKYKIKNTKTLRKCFINSPSVLITFLTIKDSGFKDMNLYNRVITDADNCNLIDSCNADSLAFFCRWSIKKRGQKNTLNTVLKRTDLYNYGDALDMFCKYFKHIPDSLKEDILKDGFTEFNHDALSNIAWQYENKNITFKYTDEQKRLEDEIDGYKFCLPENSYQLCEIGTALHNCVASYSDSVKEKRCTIVYANKDGEYKICIEVRENKICQERIDHNHIPEKEEQKVLDKWHERHGLVLERR